jgi:hypothetical protein
MPQNVIRQRNRGHPLQHGRNLLQHLRTAECQPAVFHHREPGATPDTLPDRGGNVRHDQRGGPEIPDDLVSLDPVEKGNTIRARLRTADGIGGNRLPFDEPGETYRGLSGPTLARLRDPRSGSEPLLRYGPPQSGQT